MVNDTEIMVLRYGMERQRKKDDRLWQYEDLRQKRLMERRAQNERLFGAIQSGGGSVLAALRRLTGRPAVPVNEGR